MTETMMDISATVCTLDVRMLLVFFTVLCLSVWCLSGHRNLPPTIWGPSLLFGHAWEIGESTDFYLRLLEYRRRYGDIYRLRSGIRYLYVLNGYKNIKEALVEKAEYFSNRPVLPLLHETIKGKGILFNIHNWQPARKFAISSMRDFGVGKSSLEGKIHSEMEVLMEEFLQRKAKPFNCQLLIANAVSNVICGVVFNKRFDYGDERFRSIIAAITQSFKNNPIYRPLNYMPYIFTTILFRSGLKDKIGGEKARIILANLERVKNLVRENVEQHRMNFDPDNIRDFTDLYLLSEKASEEGTAAKVTEEDAFRMILDMFIAGTETTSTTLQWLFIYMMYNQSVQDKCREEIHQVIGGDRMPSMSDRGKLIYTEATLLEVQRIATIAPLSLPHTTTHDVTVAGHTIPAGSFVIPYINSCHRDHEVWGDPDNFRPERWIGEDGQLIKNPAFVPFSLGKRVCAGESLARMEIFLFGVAFLQRFKFKMATKRPSILGHQGTTNIPKPFDLIAESCS